MLAQYFISSSSEPMDSKFLKFSIVVIIASTNRFDRKYYFRVITIAHRCYIHHCFVRNTRAAEKIREEKLESMNDFNSI